MKLTAMTIAAMMTAGLAQGELKDDHRERTLTVCVQDSALTADPRNVPMAQGAASKIFAEIGVSLEWRHSFRNCPAQAIRISLTMNTPGALEPRAWAYALPFEGTHIRVFYDRILGDNDKSRVHVVLGHVFAHEITHILQGVPRHAATGVMKARFTRLDIESMVWKPFSFEADDISLIYSGLTWRARQFVVAQNDTAVARQ